MRSEYGQMFARAAALVRNRRVGDVKRVTTCLGGSSECDPLPVVNVPRHLDWDRWLGQCPVVDCRSDNKVVDGDSWGAGHPFSRTHRYYRWWYVERLSRHQHCHAARPKTRV